MRGLVLFLVPLVQGHFLRQGAQLEIHLADAYGHGKLVDQQHKNDEQIHQIDGAFKFQQAGNPGSHLREDAQQQQEGREEQPEDAVLNLNLGLPDALEDEGVSRGACDVSRRACP